MASPNPDTLRVVLTGDGEWRGTFSEFVSANREALSITDIEAAANALMRGESWTYGGGAAPVFTLALDKA